MIERMRRRTSFCLTSKRNARWMSVSRAKRRVGPDLYFKTPSQRGDVQVPSSTREARSYFLFMSVSCASWDLLKWAG